VVPPRDATVDVVDEFINWYDIGYIWDKRGSPDLLPKNKQQMIEFNRERASKCVRSDWYSPSPRFDDKQCEQTFSLKRSIIKSILCNLANYDSFWTMSVDCRGK
jgi:hypothetical protein